jgi:hypothetical protein
VATIAAYTASVFRVSKLCAVSQCGGVSHVQPTLLKLLQCTHAAVAVVVI